MSLKDGFCFVEFNDSRCAEDACHQLNGRDLLGRRVTVDMAKGTPHGRDRDIWSYSGGRDRGRDYHRDDRRRDYHRDDRGRDYCRDDRERGGRDQPHWLVKYGPYNRTDHRVIVENLSSRVSWQDLKNYVSKGVEVSYAEAHKPPLKRHEAILEFPTMEDMRTAIDKFDGAELNGRRIKLFEESRERRRTRSRSRSPRDRSRSPRDRSPKDQFRSPRSRSDSGIGSRSKEGSDSRGRSRSKSKTPSPISKDRSSRSHSRLKSESKDENKKNRSPMKDED